MTSIEFFGCSGLHASRDVFQVGSTRAGHVAYGYGDMEGYFVCKTMSAEPAYGELVEAVLHHGETHTPGKFFVRRTELMPDYSIRVTFWQPPDKSVTEQMLTMDLV